MTTDNEPRVVVTQEDRDRAADLAHATGETWEQAGRIRRGEADGYSEDFALHRIATEDACRAREAELVEALRFLLDGRAGARDHAKATLAMIARAKATTDATGEG